MGFWMLHLQSAPLRSGMGTELHWQPSSALCRVLQSVSVLAVVPFLPVVARLTPSYLVFYPQLRHLLLPQTSADPVRVDFCFLPSEFPLVLQWFTLCIANVRFSNSAVPWTERSYFLSVLVPPTGSMGLMNACPMKD